MIRSICLSHVCQGIDTSSALDVDTKINARGPHFESLPPPCGSLYRFASGGAE